MKPAYKQTSIYGTNILYLDRDTFYTNQELCMAAELPARTSLKIILSDSDSALSEGLLHCWLFSGSFLALFWFFSGDQNNIMIFQDIAGLFFGSMEAEALTFLHR